MGQPTDHALRGRPGDALSAPFSADAEQAIRVASELYRIYAAPLTLIHICKA
jgi:hypothetical protein